MKVEWNRRDTDETGLVTRRDRSKPRVGWYHHQLTPGVFKRKGSGRLLGLIASYPIATEQDGGCCLARGRSEVIDRPLGGEQAATGGEAKVFI